MFTNKLIDLDFQVNQIKKRQREREREDKTQTCKNNIHEYDY